VTGYQWLVLIGIAVALLFTWLLLIDAVARRGRKGKTLQLDAAYRRFSSSDALPDRNRKLRLKLPVLAVLVILDVVFLGFLLSRGPGEQAVESTSTQIATPGGLSSSADPSSAPAPRSGSAAKETIQLEDLAASARPFEAVRIQGTYRGGAGTFLRLQRWERGSWLDFPLPTKTDQSGQFSTYVEFGQPGRYRLRVLDPDSGVTSEPFVVVIKG
jgi:hypothetical protein